MLFFDSYLDKLVEKEYITAVPHSDQKMTSIFKFYSNEDCQIVKDGKLVCSLVGNATEPFYFPVMRKGEYRFDCKNIITGQVRQRKECIDCDEEKTVEIDWNRRSSLMKRLFRNKGCSVTITITLILCVIVVPLGYLCWINIFSYSRNEDIRCASSRDEDICCASSRDEDRCCAPLGNSKTGGTEDYKDYQCDEEERIGSNKRSIDDLEYFIFEIQEQLPLAFNGFVLKSIDITHKIVCMKCVLDDVVIDSEDINGLYVMFKMPRALAKNEHVYQLFQLMDEADYILRIVCENKNGDFLESEHISFSVIRNVIDDGFIGEEKMEDDQLGNNKPSFSEKQDSDSLILDCEE